MLTELKMLFSKLSWNQEKRIYLKVTKTRDQTKKAKNTMTSIILLTWLVITLVWFLFENIANIGTSILAPFNNQKVTFSLFSFWIMLPLLAILVICTISWSFLHSRFSPIKNWRLIGLLQHATSELNLLKNYKIVQNEDPVKYIEWQFYHESNRLYIELLPGGHLSIELIKDMARQLTSFLILRTHNKHEWVLIDSFLDDLSATMTIIYSIARNRFIIDNIDVITMENNQIRLDSEFVFDPQKQVHLIAVGRTGSAKTTLLKTCLIQIVSDSKNKVYICDGKSSYFSTLVHSISNSKAATTGTELFELLNELVDIITERYLKLKNNVHEERDLTYLDVFPDEGHVYFLFDEILALFSQIESSDKLLKSGERLLPKIQILFSKVLQLGRAANVHVILSGQQIPATILPTSSREAFGARLILGRIDPSNATEILGVGKSSLPNVDTSNYGSLLFLDGYGWDSPKFMLLPYIDESKINYKQTLKYLTNK